MVFFSKYQNIIGHAITDRIAIIFISSWPTIDNSLKINTPKNQLKLHPKFEYEYDKCLVFSGI